MQRVTQLLEVLMQEGPAAGVLMQRVISSRFLGLISDSAPQNETSNMWAGDAAEW